MVNFFRKLNPQALRNFFRRAFFWRKKEKFKIENYWQGVARERRRIANEINKELFNH